MNLLALERKFYFPVFPRYDAEFVRGKQQFLWDARGKRYLDFFSGLGVTSLGHSHPALTRALALQAKRLWHTTQLFYAEPAILLAQELVKRSFPGKVFLSNSGAEAVECALKLARRFGSLSRRYEILCFENSFHGRTLAALSATGQRKFHQNLGPLLPGFRFARFNDMASVRKNLTRKTCAILVEPVQGEGGVHPASPDFLRGLRRLCDERKMLLMLDEVQTGVGRTGRLFAYEHFGIVPDVLILAKGLAGGLPIGATLAAGRIADLFKKGDHGSTFGGGHLASAVALSVLRRMTGQFLARVREIGSYFRERLSDLSGENLGIRDVRGLGLMAGVELNRPSRRVVEACLKRGLVIGAAGENVIRFLPSLIISRRDVDQAVSILRNVLRRMR